jgi:hypothetical protein
MIDRDKAARVAAGLACRRCGWWTGRTERAARPTLCERCGIGTSRTLVAIREQVEWLMPLGEVAAMADTVNRALVAGYTVLAHLSLASPEADEACLLAYREGKYLAASSWTRTLRAHREAVEQWLDATLERLRALGAGDEAFWRLGAGWTLTQDRPWRTAAAAEAEYSEPRRR